MSTLQQQVQASLNRVNERISAAAQAVSRDPASVTLLAVSKTFGADAVAAAAHCGQRDFGENYVQEGVDKIAEIRRRAETDPALTGVRWHFIGPLQSNKTRAVAEYFDWVQSIDRLKIAERLSAQRPAAMAPLNVLLQVNISGEASKSGANPADVSTLAAAVATLPRLSLRGLMAIPEPETDPTRQRVPLASLRELFDDLRGRGFALDTLSMGMSADLEAAVAEGATLVRVGTAIFGARAAAAPQT